MFNHPKKQLLLLISIWMLAQLTCFFLWGTQTGLESTKYIGAADYLLQHGSFPEKRYWFYSITVFIIAFSKLINFGHGFVFFFQLLLSLTAHLSFFNGLKSQCRENHPAPFITTAILCLILPYQQWNFSLYTESLFYSLVLLFFSSCIDAKYETPKFKLKQLFLLLTVILARPLGILFLIPWLTFHLWYLIKKRKRLVSVLLGFGIVILILICEIILSNIKGYDILEAYKQGNVICGIATFNQSSFAIGIEKTSSSIWNLILYIRENPILFLNLSWKKTIAFFLMFRDYYQWRHNFLLLVLCAILYLPTVFNFLKEKINPFSRFIYLIIISFYLAVVLQCDDYHSRFVLTLVPLFLYVGLFQLIQRIIRS
jgi:hypothetical protein